MTEGTVFGGKSELVSAEKPCAGQCRVICHVTCGCLFSIMLCYRLNSTWFISN